MSGNPKFFYAQTNASDPMMARYAKQVDSTVMMGQNNDACRAEFNKNFQELNKSVDGDDLHIKPFVYHKVRPMGELGVDHYAPLGTRALQYFGLKTGNGVDPFAPIPYPRKFSAFGE